MLRLRPRLSAGTSRAKADIVAGIGPPSIGLANSVPASTHGQASADAQSLSSDVAGVIRGKKSDQPTDISRISSSSKRNRPKHCIDDLFAGISLRSEAC